MITKGAFDVIDLKHINPKEGFVYYLTSPNNASQKYLYKTRLNGKEKSELLSPKSLKETHDYNFSANGKYAEHRFSNHCTRTSKEFITVDNQQALTKEESIVNNLERLEVKPTTEFFSITTPANVTMDGWMDGCKTYKF